LSCWSDLPALANSTFVRKHFKPTEVLSSDYCRGLVSDDENSQAATKDAFEVLQFIAAKRLAVGKLTVIDATNVQVEARKPLIALAREYHCIPTAIVFDVPERLCAVRNAARPDRDFGRHVIRQQIQQMRRSLRSLDREGVRHISILSSVEEVEGATIERQRLWTDRRDERGPFDIIGDVHGCRAELETLGTISWLRNIATDAKPYSWATWSTGAQILRAWCEPSCGWSRAGRGCASPAITTSS
jgi:protein phosphatase